MSRLWLCMSSDVPIGGDGDGGGEDVAGEDGGRAKDGKGNDGGTDVIVEGMVDDAGTDRETVEVATDRLRGATRTG